MKWSRLVLATFFVVAGIGHLVAPTPYLRIMPSFVPWPEAIVAVSGIAEVCGGLGLLTRATRRWAGWGLIALLVAVFPANIQALFTGLTIAGHAAPAWLLWARLPLQPALIVWVYYASLHIRKSGSHPPRP
jgi:uncharacterized membrane protein